ERGRRRNADGPPRRPEPPRVLPRSRRRLDGNLPHLRRRADHRAGQAAEVALRALRPRRRAGTRASKPAVGRVRQVGRGAGPMKFAICNELFEGWPWEKVCDFVRGLGYTGLEVAPFTLADSAEQVSPQRRLELRRAAETRGVEVMGVHWLRGWPTGTCISHTDAAVCCPTADYSAR